MSLIGIHIGMLDDIIKTIDTDHHFNNINLIQIFISATTDYSDKKYVNVIKYLIKNKIKLVVHGSYSINLAKHWSDIDWWIQQFIAEVKGSAQLNAFGIVIHTGKQLKLSTAEALNNMYTSLLHIHHKTESYQQVRIIIETPSGQGTETLTQIQEFCRFMKKFYTHPDEKVRDRFGICVDTCHIFVAGNDIRTKKDMNYFFGSIDRSIGIDKIKLCHLNDSKKGLGQHIDRHMTIGKGMIGKDAIVSIVEFMKELDIPIVIETPDDQIGQDYDFVKSI
jgi:deoxyribonuclease-4